MAYDACVIARLIHDFVQIDDGDYDWANEGIFVTSLVRRLTQSSGYLSDAVYSCGNIQAICSQTVSNSIASLFQALSILLDISNQCPRKWDFNSSAWDGYDDLHCAYNSFYFITASLFTAKNLDTAIGACPDIPAEQQIANAADGGDGDDGDDGDDDGSDDGGESTWLSSL